MPDVLMPRLSDTMEEGTLSQWLKHEGDEVHNGDILAVIETDKAAMDLEAYDEGVLTGVLVAEGTTVPIGATIAVINGGAAGMAGQGAAEQGAAEQRAPETAGQDAGEQGPAGPEPPGAGQAPPEPSGPPQGPLARADGPARTRTSPLARRIARRHGIDLATITGSGPGDRIVRADVEAAVRLGQRPGPALQPPAPASVDEGGRPQAAGRPVQAPAGPALPPRPASPQAAPRLRGTEAGEAEEIPLSPVRRITAERLTRSARDAPHFYLTVAADAGPLLAFRAQANERLAAKGVKVSVTDLLIKACATTLASHPAVNASWEQTQILRYHQINIGIAVAIDDGLIVPVIRGADRKTVTEIAREARTLAEKARAGRLTPGEFAGGTFTISNLGMYGIDNFTAVVNPPQAAILAVGAATRQPVVRDDQLAVGTTMALTLCIDHRVLDGATGSAFLADLRALLAEPLRIVL